MEFDVSPEPTPAERAAIAAALRRLLAEEPGIAAPAWWTAGVRENLDEDED